MSVLATHQALATAAALRAADRLGVVAALSTAALDVEGVSEQCGLNERGSRLLLRTLAALGVVEPAGGGRYSASDEADLFRGAVALYDGLEESVRTGRPIQRWSRNHVAAEMYPKLVAALGQQFDREAERLADLLAGTGGRILDLAAGAAPWSLPLAARCTEASVTAVDLPEVLPATRRVVKEHGLEDRYRFLAADAFTDDLGGPYDLALVGNFCHLFGAEANTELLQRVRRVLAPSGRLAIIDVMPPLGCDPAPQVALYELSLLLRTSAGAAHPFSAYVDWLVQSGYRDIEQVELDAATGMAAVLAAVA